MVEYQVIRCYKCGTFQVQQKKKVPKWSCTLCGEKQSLKKVYAVAYQAKDLRPVAQDYNMRRAEIDEQDRQAALETALTAARAPELKQEPQKDANPRASEWEDFIDHKDVNIKEEVVDDDEDFLGNTDSAWQRFQSGRGRGRDASRSNSTQSRSTVYSKKSSVGKWSAEPDELNAREIQPKRKRDDTFEAPSAPSRFPWKPQAQTTAGGRSALPARPFPSPFPRLLPQTTLEEDAELKDDSEIVELMMSRRKRVSNGPEQFSDDGAAPREVLPQALPSQYNPAKNIPGNPITTRAATLWSEFEEDVGVGGDDDDDGSDCLASAPPDGGSIFWR